MFIDVYPLVFGVSNIIYMFIDDVPIETSNAMFDYRRAMVDAVLSTSYIVYMIYVMKEICPVRHPKLCALKKNRSSQCGESLGK